MSNIKAFASFWQKQHLHYLQTLVFRNHQHRFHHINSDKLVNYNNFIRIRLIHVLLPSQSREQNTQRYFATKNGIEPDTKIKLLRDDISEKDVNKIDHYTKVTGNTNVDESVFSEIFISIEKTYTKNYLRDCEWRLYNWGKLVEEKKNANKEINLDVIVSDSLYSVAELVLTPSAPPYMRHKLLALLLNDKKDRKITEKILRETVDDVTILPVSVVADIIQDLTACAETPLRRQVRLELVQAIVNKRWYEIPAKYIVFFMYQLDSLFDMRDITHKFYISIQESKHLAEEGDSGRSSAASKNNQTLMGDVESLPIVSVNLETRVLNLVDELKSKDLAKVIVLLSRWKNRNQTVLNSVIHRLIMADLSEFSFVQLNNLLYACSILNYRNEKFLGKITSQMSEFLPECSSLACTVLTSLSHLRWRNDGLITNCKKSIFDDLKILSAKDAKNSLLSLANLLELPSNDKEISHVRELSLVARKENFMPFELVTFGWCLAVLKCLPADQAKTLLQPEFVQETLASCEGYLKKTALQRLAGISFTAKYEMNDYMGQFLSDDILKLAEVISFCTDKKLIETFEKAIGKFADMKTYVQSRQVLQDGLTADYIMNANKTGDVRPIQVAQSEQGNENVYRLALQLVSFSGVIGPTHSIIGSYHITARMLRHLGYVPVHITYLDLKPTLGVLEHINNITSKIKSALRNIPE